ADEDFGSRRAGHLAALVARRPDDRLSLAARGARAPGDLARLEPRRRALADGGGRSRSPPDGAALERRRQGALLRDRTEGDDAGVPRRSPDPQGEAAHRRGPHGPPLQDLPQDVARPLPAER